jgi:hypothetical protein
MSVQADWFTGCFVVWQPTGKPDKLRRLQSSASEPETWKDNKAIIHTACKPIRFFFILL